MAPFSPMRRPRPERSVLGLADRIADVISRSKYLVLFLFSALYFLTTCFRASRKLFWFDELFTVYLSRLPSMASVWAALKHGVDFNPPLFYLLTRFSESLFGEGHVATRLPEIAGFWIFCLCLFRFVSIRTSVLAGAISMLFPMVTEGYYYAYEARPHGVVLGFAGLALVCWQGAIHSRRRAWWLTGLFASLLCAIATHTYGILLVVPFALAEISRTLSRRRIDWGMWLTIVAPLSGVLLSLPQFRATKSILPKDFFPARLMTLADSWQFHLAPAAGVLGAALVLYFVFSLVPASSPARPEGERSPDRAEVVALLGFLAIPVFAYAVARLTGAPLMQRYTISAVAGFACLLGMAMGKKSAVGLGVLFVLLAQIGINLVQDTQTGTLIEPITSIVLAPMKTLEREYAAIETLPDKKSPIVLLDVLEYLPLMHYAPPDIVRRLVYLAPDAETGGENIGLQECCGAPGRVEGVSDFISAHDTFIALCSRRSLPRLNDFIDAGAEVKVESISPDAFLASVDFRKKPREAASLPPADWHLSNAH